jgi:hypothetical protein
MIDSVPPLQSRLLQELEMVVPIKYERAYFDEKGRRVL